MRVHITNIYGIGGTPKAAQQMIADIAKKNFHYNELGIYTYEMKWDTSEMLRTRLDGIAASLSYGDIVIFQPPSWNGIEFDEAFVNVLDMYQTKKIFFVHDVPPLIFESNRCLLQRTIDVYNRADLLILPSTKMEKFLRTEGLNVSKIVVQRMWDCPVDVDETVVPRFRKILNFAGDTNIEKFSFAKAWNYDTVKLAVTAKEGDWEHGDNIEFLGWLNGENKLADVLRKNGGFGLLWTEDETTKQYMVYCACCKLGTYLGAGLPVVVPSYIPEAQTIVRKNLGLAVDSLDEAVQQIKEMQEGQYDQMVQNVWEFGKLIRDGYFAKKVLADAVFRLLYE